MLQTVAAQVHRLLANLTVLESTATFQTFEQLLVDFEVGPQIFYLLSEQLIFLQDELKLVRLLLMRQLLPQLLVL